MRSASWIHLSLNRLPQGLSRAISRIRHLNTIQVVISRVRRQFIGQNEMDTCFGLQTKYDTLVLKQSVFYGCKVLACRDDIGNI